ncbi:MAG TPA: zinc-dependent metalloprotease [Candidatus Anoxymicrobiaceae bacterium]|jgi:coenzyme F420 biosynthesis associated uncharacterized protein
MAQQPPEPLGPGSRGQADATSFLEAIFNAIDSVARRIAEFAPLGRGVRNAMRTGDGLISWEDVRDIAAATLELQRNQPEAITPAIVEAYQHMLADAKVQVAAYTDLKVSGLPEKVDVFGHLDWIDANIVSFRFLFDPISRKYVEMLEEMQAEQGLRGGRRAQKFARGILSLQVGIIMGYLSRNVLGQFDLSLPEPEKGSKLYVVEPNVRRVDDELGLEPIEFRQWITLHEVTHSFEFHSNGWLMDYISSSMRQYLESIDLRGMARPDFFRRMREQKRGAGEGDALKAGGLISIVSTPEQRAILARLQGVMSVLEGYSNHVMDAVGKELLQTYEDMKKRFERRRENKSAVERLFQRLIGIDLKLQQYKLGEKFVNAVVDAEGLQFMNRVWENSDRMPTMEEINNPTAWIARIKSGRGPAKFTIVPGSAEE